MSDDTPYVCPLCGADLTGDEIPNEHLFDYGGARHFSRAIAIYSIDLDRTTHYQCPDCNGKWSR